MLKHGVGVARVARDAGDSDAGVAPKLMIADLCDRHLEVSSETIDQTPQHSTLVFEGMAAI